MRGRRGLLLAVAAVIVVLAGAYAWWSSSAESSDTIAVAGDVRAELRTIAAPAIVTPTTDYAIGIPVASGAGPTAGAKKPAAGSPSGRAPRVAGMLATVTVVVGDHVDAGQVIAKLDTTMLDMGVEQARLAAVRARAEVGVLDSGLTKVADNRSKLATAKGKLATAKSQLRTARTQLTTTRATLVATRAKALAGRVRLLAQIAQLERLIGSGNATSTPPAPSPQQILAGMKAKLAQLDAGVAKLNAGIKQVDAGLAKVAQGFTKLSSASVQIATGQSALNTAVRQLGNAKDVLGILADGRLLALQMARAARDSATVTSPVAGTVAFARTAGTVAMVGAPLVKIRPDGAPRVDTYLTAEQLTRVALGDFVELTLDSAPGRIYRGKVTQVGTAYQYPPNTFPTPLTHMTRAVKVTITLDTDTVLPAGTPVDLIIRTTARG